MNELDDLLRRIEEMDAVEDRHPFPYDDIRALYEVFQDEFDRLGPDQIFTGDLNLFCYTIHGWAAGGLRLDLPDAGHRYRARVWLSNSFFDRFPVYGFLEPYDLSEYRDLHRTMELAERLRQMLLEAIRLYELRASNQ